MLAVVLLSALAALSWQVGWFGGGNGPLAVADVPSELPARGVQLENEAIVLRPWTTARSRAMAADQAIAAARHFSSHPNLPATALKAEVTIRGGWPMRATPSPSQRTPPHHERVWLVTFTSPTPINIETDGIRRFYVTQFSEALDPVTGKFEFGFETPVSS